MNNLLNYIAKDVKEGEALQDSLAGLQNQLWIAGDTARRMVTALNPEDAKSLELVASCDEHAPTVELLEKNFKLTPVTGGYKFNVGPIPTTVIFSDIGDYLASRRYAGLGVVVSLLRRVPIVVPEFYFAPPTTDVSGSQLPTSAEEQNSLVDLVIFEAGLAERMALKMKEQLNKPATEPTNEVSNSNPVSATATD